MPAGVQEGIPLIIPRMMFGTKKMRGIFSKALVAKMGLRFMFESNVKSFLD